MEVNVGDRLLTVAALAKLVPWSEAVLRSMIAAGHLPATRIGRRVVVHEADAVRVLGLRIQ